MQNSKTFFLCTDSIEHSFAHTEVLQAAANFKSVVLVTLKKTILPLPANVTELVLSYAEFNAGEVLRKRFFVTSVAMCNDLFLRSFNFNYYKTFKSNLNYLLQSIYLSQKIETFIEQNKIDKNQALFVSFWFNTWAIALAVLKKQNKILDFYSRAHGTDLFEYRVRNTQRLPFRKFQLKWVSKVFSVSANGSDYLKENYPSYAAKIFPLYLGTKDHGTNNFSDKSVFTIVSCATVRNIKRIYLIPEILQQLNFQVKWVHLGDENLAAPDPTKERYLKNKEAVKKYSWINAVFSGSLSNQQIFNFYKTNSINLFISVSETEGLPVSIMEAISFGIPVMATDVGGCKEICTAQTGMLIPKDFTIADAAKRIRDFKDSIQNTPEFRNQTRDFWKTNFEVNANYQKFYAALEQK